MVFRVLAGLKFTRKQQPRLVNNVGRLCKWEHGELGDRRWDDEFNSFASFNMCDEGDSALLQLTPNVTWPDPDVVYYHSYTTPYMGWKIHIVDNFRQKPRRSGFGAASHTLPSVVSLSLLICALLTL